MQQGVRAKLRKFDTDRLETKSCLRFYFCLLLLRLDAQDGAVSFLVAGKV
jgi:hypothetical protein